MNDHPDALGWAYLVPQRTNEVAARAKDTAPLLPLAGASNPHCLVPPTPPTWTPDLQTSPPLPTPDPPPPYPLHSALPPLTPQKRKLSTVSSSDWSTPTPPAKRRRTTGVSLQTPQLIASVSESLTAIKVEDALQHRPNASTYRINRYTANEKNLHGVLSSAARKKNKLAKPVWSTKVPRNASNHAAGQNPLISEFASTTCQPPIWASDFTELRDAVPQFQLDPDELLRRQHILFFDKTDQPGAGDGWTESGAILTVTLSRSYTRHKDWPWIHGPSTAPLTHSSTPTPLKEENTSSAIQYLEAAAGRDTLPALVPVALDATVAVPSADARGPPSTLAQASYGGTHFATIEDSVEPSSVQHSLAVLVDIDADIPTSLPLIDTDGVFKMEEDSAVFDSVLKSEPQADPKSSVAFASVGLDWSGSIVKASPGIPFDVDFSTIPLTLLEKQHQREVVRMSRDGCTLSEQEQVMLPREIRAIWSMASQQQPLLVVCHRDWSLAPCNFGKEAGVGYVGCFFIDHVREEVEEGATSAQGTVYWRLKLRWVSHPRLDIHTPIQRPWYATTRSTSLPAASIIEWDKPSVNPVSHPLKTEDSMFGDVNPSNVSFGIRGWVCKCGRANRRWDLRRLSCIQTDCQQPDFPVPMPDFSAMLDDHLGEPQSTVPDLLWDKAALHTYVRDFEAAPKRIDYHDGTSVVTYTHGSNFGLPPVHRVSRIAGFAATRRFSCDILKAYYEEVPFKGIDSSANNVFLLRIPEVVMEFSLPPRRYGPSKALPSVFAHGTSMIWGDEDSRSRPAWHSQTPALFQRLYDLRQLPSPEIGHRRIIVALFWPATLGGGLIIRTLRDKSQDLAIAAFGSLVSMIDASRPSLTEPAKKGKDAPKPTPFTLSLNSGDAFVVEAQTSATAVSPLAGTLAQHMSNSSSTKVLTSSLAEVEADPASIDMLAAPATRRSPRKQTLPVVPKQNSQASKTKGKAIKREEMEEDTPVTADSGDSWRIESKGPAMLLLSFTRR